MKEEHRENGNQKIILRLALQHQLLEEHSKKKYHRRKTRIERKKELQAIQVVCVMFSGTSSIRYTRTGLLGQKTKEATTYNVITFAQIVGVLLVQWANRTHEKTGYNR